MKKCRVGLEIAEKTLQFAIVAKLKNGWRLIETLSLPVTADKMPHVLQEARRAIGKAIRNVILSVPYSQVLMKEIHLDSSLSPPEIYLFLQQQSPALFGKPAGEWLMDFEPCPFPANISRQNCFRAVAAAKGNILPWFRLCREAGLRVRAVDIDILALARLGCTFEGYEHGQPQALIWLKSTELLFIVAQDGRLIYAKRTAHTPLQSLTGILTPLLQFFHGLFPQYRLENIVFLNENSPLPEDPLIINSAALNPAIWQISSPVMPHEFCSLGLAIHEY